MGPSEHRERLPGPGCAVLLDSSHLRVPHSRGDGRCSKILTHYILSKKKKEKKRKEKRKKRKEKTYYIGQPRWHSGLVPPAAQGVILETLDRVPCRALCI